MRLLDVGLECKTQSIIDNDVSPSHQNTALFPKITHWENENENTNIFLQIFNRNILKSPEKSVEHNDDNKHDICGMLAGHLEQVQDMET